MLKNKSKCSYGHTIYVIVCQFKTNPPEIWMYGSEADFDSKISQIFREHYGDGIQDINSELKKSIIQTLKEKTDVYSHRLPNGYNLYLYEDIVEIDE